MEEENKRYDYVEDVEISKEMKYYVSPVRLECDVSMNDGWENELLRRIIDMLCTVNDDYDMLGHLGEGAVPEEIQCAIRNLRRS